jgi:hypothetical protein
MWFAHQIILISRNHSRANNATDYHFISSNLNQNWHDKYQPLKVDYKLKDLNFIPQESYKLTLKAAIKKEMMNKKNSSTD